MRGGDPKPAADLWDKIIRLDPDKAKWWAGLGC